MGALLAFGLAYYLEVHTRHNPDFVLASACRPPFSLSKVENIAAKNDQQFVEKLIKYGSTLE